jgi:hypothetical protein
VAEPRWLVTEPCEVVEWTLTGDSLHFELLDAGLAWHPETPQPVVMVSVLKPAVSKELEHRLAALADDGVWRVGRTGERGSVIAVLESEDWSVQLPCEDLLHERLDVSARHLALVVGRLRTEMDRVYADDREKSKRILKTQAFVRRAIDRADRILRSSGSEGQRARAKGRVQCLSEVLNILGPEGAAQQRDEADEA